MQQTFHDFSAFDVLKGKRPLLVCDDAYDSFDIRLPCEFVKFSGFKPNPLYRDAMAGVKVLREAGCDFILAIGGGSSIDVAKGIKHYHTDPLPLMAVPTTSGTGSEATHFAVLYNDGEKYSVSDDKKSLLPDYAVLQPDLIKTLPVYQKKCTMLDALCQAIESWWSVRSTPESIEYSREAIKLVIAGMAGCLKNDTDGNKDMLTASNLAGKAINITTTTAPHAMSYKLTSLYRLPHGHAVAICLPKVWRRMGNFDDIANALGAKNCDEAVVFFEQLLHELDILPPDDARVSDLDVLTSSVNLQRLSNNPIRFSECEIKELYKEILEV